MSYYIHPDGTIQNWYTFSMYLRPDDMDLIRKFQHKIKWRQVCFRYFDESFIEEFHDKVSKTEWRAISLRKLSDDFIRKFGDKLDSESQSGK